MRFLLLALLASGGLPTAFAQPATTPADTVATRLQLPKADCALFPAAATIPSSDVFESDYKPGMERFAPTAEQVTQAEAALPAVQFDRVSARPEPTDNYDDYPVIIKKHLADYQRQYYGFIDKHKHPCLFINFFIEKHDDVPGQPPYWLNHAVRLQDGGWEYWSIYYDLNAHKFFHFEHSQEG
ncbi:MAG: hypothetical protein ACRYFX_31825 [Janthinobacterium lividum]